MSARYFETLRMIEDIATTLGNQNKLTHKGPIYHVKVDPNQDTWKITCLGTECVDCREPLYCGGNPTDNPYGKSWWF